MRLLYWKNGMLAPNGESPRVLVNGETLPLAIEASVVGGWARAYATPPGGGPILQDVWRQPVTRDVTGFVEIVTEDEHTWFSAAAPRIFAGDPASETAPGLNLFESATLSAVSLQPTVPRDSRKHRRSAGAWVGRGVIPAAGRK